MSQSLPTTVLPGDFACVPVSGAVGLGIEVGQFLAGCKFKPYEHAEIYLGMPDADGPYGYTCSAYPDGNGMRALDCPPQALPGALWSTGIIPLTDVQRSGIVAWCVTHEHVRYAGADYLALAAHRFHLNTEALQEFIAAQHSMICSQYVDTGYNVGGGVHLFSDGRWPGYVMPMSLAALLEVGPV